MLLEWTTCISFSPHPPPNTHIVVNSNYPMHMHKGSLVIVVVVVDTKIAKSGDLSTWVSCKHNKYVEIGEKLASVCSESSGTAYIQASQIAYFSWPSYPHPSTVPTMYYVCDFCSCAWLASSPGLCIILCPICMIMQILCRYKVIGTCRACTLRALITSMLPHSNQLRMVWMRLGTIIII